MDTKLTLEDHLNTIYKTLHRHAQCILQLQGKKILDPALLEKHGKENIVKIEFEGHLKQGGNDENL